MPETFDAFLSHMSRDKPAVRRVAKALADAGLNVWFDEWNIVPGASWQDAIGTAIENSNAAIIFIGESGIGPWQQSEFHAALQYKVTERRPIIPVILPGAEHTELPGFLRAISRVEIKSWNDADFQDALNKIIWGITGTLPSTPPPPPPTEIPRVFLCHAKEDDPQVERLYFQLRDYDIDPWYDKEKLTIGDRWEQEIIAAIENTDFFAMCLSPRSVTKNGFIQREIKLAIKEYQRRPQQFAFLLPVRLEPCDVPPIKLDDVTTLSDFQWIDLYEDEADSLRRFADGVKAQFAKRKNGK
jgi:hypothetical protein